MRAERLDPPGYSIAAHAGDDDSRTQALDFAAGGRVFEEEQIWITWIR